MGPWVDDLCAVSTGVGSTGCMQVELCPCGSVGSDLCAVSTGVGSLVARR